MWRTYQTGLGNDAARFEGAVGPCSKQHPLSALKCLSLREFTHRVAGSTSWELVFGSAAARPVNRCHVKEDRLMLNNKNASKFREQGMRTKSLGWTLVYMQICVAVVLSFYGGLSARAGSVDYPDSMVCGTYKLRPDKIASVREQIINTSNGSIAYYRFGHGSPIVFLTGYRATISEWNVYFLETLAERHEIIVYDNRGVGRSISAAVRYGIKDMADDAAKLISSLGLRDVTVVGWSMGGAVAQQLALDAPQDVRRLVLINAMAPGRLGEGPPPSVIRTLSGEGPTHFSAVMRLLFPEPAVHRAEKCFIQDMFSPQGYQPASVSASAAQAQEEIMRKWLRSDSVYHDLRKITFPVLLLAGQDDTVLSPKNSDSLHKVFSKSTLTSYRNGGHAMMYQYPRQMAAQIVKFIHSDNVRGFHP
ncbi:alpha/beta hydrolase [Pseudomonas sp. ST1]|nr:alpha/beta hydrolase [Pseudomonas savastanoi]TSC27260.1 alpha/beta hydrolase [Pseudomonas sp. ST1]